MEKVWTIIGLIWAVTLGFIAIAVLESAIKAKIDEIKARRMHKQMVDKLKKGLSDAIDKQIDNILNDKDCDNEIEKFANEIAKEFDEEDNDE